MGDDTARHVRSPMSELLPLTSELGFIGAKLSPPRLHRQHVPRRRLVEQLEAGSDRALLLLQAPAGSGKSTLLSEWLAVLPWTSGWVSLDASDNELGRFLGYLLAAVQGMFPDASLATRDLLQALTLPPLDALASSLCADLDRLPADFVLVLDDYHVITNDQVHQILEQVLRYPPARMHLAIASRSEPPWPLTRLRARDQVTEIRYEDLLFTPEESSAFLRKVLGDALDHDFAVVLHEESEGWAAGLQLMALAIRGHKATGTHLPRMSVAREDIETFLLDEVFAAQPPAVQDRLLQLSILNRFSAPLVESVCAEDADACSAAGWGQAFLATLVHANLFIIPLDDDHEFFRFHHLFQSFLARRLAERNEPDTIANLHHRASRWLEAQDLIEEAVDHALAAGATETAADIVARHRHSLYNKDQFARLTRWLRLLPPEAKEHHAGLLLAEARIAILNSRFTEAAVFLDHAESELAKQPRDPAPGTLDAAELMSLRSVLDFWAGDVERFESASRHLLSVLPPGASHLRGMAHTGIASAAYMRGDLAGGLRYLDSRLGEKSPRSPGYAWLLQTQAFLYWIDGDWTRLWQAATRLLQVSEELELADQEALAHLLLGTVHYARNELTEAESQLTEAVEARFVMRLMWWTQAAGLLALTYQATDRPSQARQEVEDAQAFLLARHALRLLPSIGAFAAELNRRQGRMAEAIAWSRQVEPVPLTWALSSVEPRVAQARALLADNDASSWDQAALLLAELREFCTRLPNRRLRLEVDILSALLADRQGRHEEALDTVLCAVRAAEPGGGLRPFLDHGDAVEHLLRQLGAKGSRPLAVERILAAFPSRATNVLEPDQTHLAEPLSQRELEILALLGDRESNKEIAARLFIAPATVKRHTLHIYRKLDVNDRRQAVDRATRLGLLPA
ncbi:MAG: hypothetical protein JNM64_01845 [Chloroflexia bacterium]|nr:hypothetical protein [Chloroflexia bacterium]